MSIRVARRNVLWLVLLTVMGIATPAQAARFRFESTDGTLVWDGTRDVSTSNRLADFTSYERGRSLRDLGFEDPADLFLRLSLVIDDLDEILAWYPDAFPDGFQPFELLDLDVIVTLDTSKIPHWEECREGYSAWFDCTEIAMLTQHLIPISWILDAETEEELDFEGANLDDPIVAFYGQMGPLGPAADGSIFGLTNGHEAYRQAVARFGPGRLIVGLSAEFKMNCFESPDDGREFCREEPTLETLQSPEPAALGLLLIGTASIIGRLRQSS